MFSKKKIYKKKVRDLVKRKEHKKVAATQYSRQRIPRSKWPALIQSYERTFDKMQWAKDNGITTKNPYRLYKSWTKILAKEREENQ